MKLLHILFQTSTGGLSQTHQVNEEQRSYSIDLELKVHEEDIGKDLLHRESDDGLLNYLDEAKYDLVCEGGVIFTLG
jgi:hypothetical protein